MTTSLRVRAASFSAGLALVALGVADATAAETIGKATSIATAVTATLATQQSTLKTGDAIYADQIVSTDANGVGQFEFRDKTKLAIGPGSTIVLDDFIYNSKASAAKVVVNLTKGSFRFITGSSNHDAYDIVTPTATIGVRGTAFDVYVDDRGEMAVAMINGAVEVCPRLGACRLHNVVGEFLHMTRDGLFSLHKTWDGTFLRDIQFKRALPFLDNQRLLVPSLRGQTKIVGLYAAGAVGAVGDVVKDIPKALPKVALPKTTLPKLPTLKVPKLFR